MAKPSSWPFLDLGATMLSRLSPCVFLPKHTNKPTTFFKYCKLLDVPCLLILTMPSAELEMTVNMLIQIDKLVQLLESPVFTCTNAGKYLSALLTSSQICDSSY